MAAIEKEVQSLRTLTKRNYSYCCGLLVMLTKICQRFALTCVFHTVPAFHSRCDVEVFTQHCNLLVSLTELLLFSAPVVQCQVIDALEKVRKRRISRKMLLFALSDHSAIRSEPVRCRISSPQPSTAVSQASRRAVARSIHAHHTRRCYYGGSYRG